MIRYLLVMTFILCVSVPSSYSDDSHKFTFMIGKYAGKRYCLYCHKSRSPYELKPMWKDESIKEGYNYLSPDVDEKSYRKMVGVFRKITNVCLSCHTDYASHEDIHPISVNIMESDQRSLSVHQYKGKINGVLPLFGKNKEILECPTCHDPHTKEASLLRVGKNKLCKSCHKQ